MQTNYAFMDGMFQPLLWPPFGVLVKNLKGLKKNDSFYPFFYARMQISKFQNMLPKHFTD